MTNAKEISLSAQGERFTARQRYAPLSKNQSYRTSTEVS